MVWVIDEKRWKVSLAKLTIDTLAMNAVEKVAMCAREKQVHRDALLHESYTKAIRVFRGRLDWQCGRFEFIKETVESFRSEATSAALENFARYMTQPGRIQSHGVYHLADEMLGNKIIACSANTEIFFGCHHKYILGACLSDLFVEGAKTSAAQSISDISLANPVILTPSNRSDLEASNSSAGCSPSSSSGTVSSRRRVNVIFHRSEDGLILDISKRWARGDRGGLAGRRPSQSTLNTECTACSSPLRDVRQFRRMSWQEAPSHEQQNRHEETVHPRGKHAGEIG